MDGDEAIALRWKALKPQAGEAGARELRGAPSPAFPARVAQGPRAREAGGLEGRFRGK
jgi:hypothetical protein